MSEVTLIHVLQHHGFSEKEARVYLAALQIERGSASTIARKAGEKRLTTYNTLKSLIQKGVATEYLHNGVARYTVISPELLLQKEEVELHKRISELGGILPQLLAITNTLPNKPKVYFYDGLNGLKTMYEDSLSSAYMCAILSRENMDPAFAEYLYDDYVPRRIEKKIQTRLIYAKDSAGFHHEFVSNNNSTDHFREIVLIEDNEFILKNSIFFHSETKISIAMFASHELC